LGDVYKRLVRDVAGMLEGWIREECTRRVSLEEGRGV